VPWRLRAGNGTRTRDPNLGKVVLYQLSYSRESCRIVQAGPGLGNRVKTPVCAASCYQLGSAVEARGIEPLTS
jgi:hypothetical protein